MCKLTHLATGVKVTNGSKIKVTVQAKEEKRKCRCECTLSLLNTRV